MNIEKLLNARSYLLSELATVHCEQQSHTCRCVPNDHYLERHVTQSWARQPDFQFQDVIGTQRQPARLDKGAVTIDVAGHIMTEVIAMPGKLDFEARSGRLLPTGNLASA